MANVDAETVGALLTLLGWDGTKFANVVVNAAGQLQVEVVGMIPDAHAATHEDGGADELDLAGMSGDLADEQDAKVHGLVSDRHDATTLIPLNTMIADADVDDAGDPRDPNAHAATHEDGGADEISVAGLSGVLADDQPFAAHLLGGAKHTADSLADLNLLIDDADVDDDGDPRDPNAHAASHQNGGADELSVADLSGLLGDGQTPLGHHASHENGGADEGSLTGLSGMDKAIEFIIDGGGAAITVGEKGHLAILVACDIISVTMYADQSGSIVVDIWNDSYTNFPPTNADTITSVTPPTITTAQKSFNNTLTDWTTLLSASTVLAFNVDSCTDIERVTIALHVRTH